jgi:hypothetical protein
MSDYLQRWTSRLGAMCKIHCDKMRKFRAPSPSISITVAICFENPTQCDHRQGLRCKWKVESFYRHLMCVHNRPESEAPLGDRRTRMRPEEIWHSARIVDLGQANAPPVGAISDERRFCHPFRSTE